MYGTISLSKPYISNRTASVVSIFELPYLDSDERGGLEESSEEGCCWVCQGVIEDPGDLFYPCNCKLHKKCIKQWVAKVSTSVIFIMEEKQQ